MSAGLVLGILVSVINTRFLGPETFGDYKFLETLFTFSVTFITFGVFVTGGRIVAQNKNAAIKNDVFGGLIGLAAISSIVFSLLIFLFSFFEEQIFENQLGTVMRAFSPLLFIFPFRLCLENMLQGDNRIYELSVFRLLPQFLYMSFAVGVNFLIPLDLTMALLIQYLAFGLTIAGMSIWLKPKFSNVRDNVKLIWHENLSYGFHIYLGAIAGVSTGQLGGISLAYFVDNTSVGFYSLAMTLTLPLSMIPNAIGTTLFKEFANSRNISVKMISGTVGLSVSALSMFLLVSKPLIRFLYSEDFIEVVPLVYVTAVAAIFYGFGDFLNRFLGAQGKGVDLRNGAFLVGLSNVLGFTFLVSIFGIFGAVATRLGSGIIYFLIMVTFYQKHMRDQKGQP